MLKKGQLFILTGIAILGVWLIIQSLFQNASLEVPIIQNGIEVMVFCFVKHQILFAILPICVIALLLGIFWGEYLTLKYPAKKE